MSEVGLVPFARVALEVSQEVVPVYSHRFSPQRFSLADAEWGRLPDGHVVGKPVPLFPRIETIYPTSKSTKLKKCKVLIRVPSCSSKSCHD
jgi:hypothetical protein